VLQLRAGIGTARGYSARAVANILQLSLVREAQVEHSALAQLQVAAADGRCGSASIAMLQVPARDRLVRFDALLANPRHPAATVRAARRAVSAVHLQRARGPVARGAGIQGAVIASLQIASSAAGPWIIGAVVLLGALGMLSAAGRRLVARQHQATPASAMATPVVAPATPASAMATPVAAIPTPAPTLAPERIPPAPVVEPEASQPSLVPASVFAPGRPSAGQAWLRTHRSQIALVLAAAAGGALRLITRERRHRRH
jgi:hypothetical protein